MLLLYLQYRTAAVPTVLQKDMQQQCVYRASAVVVAADLRARVRIQYKLHGCTTVVRLFLIKKM